MSNVSTFSSTHQFNFSLDYISRLLLVQSGRLAMCSVFRFQILFFLWSSVSKVFGGNLTTTDPASGGNRNEGRFVPPPPPLFPSLLFPVNAATGILVAIAVPITDLPYQNAFVSYNFESNYNMPNIPADDFPGLIQLNGPTRVRIIVFVKCFEVIELINNLRCNSHMTNLTCPCL